MTKSIITIENAVLFSTGKILREKGFVARETREEEQYRR